MTTLGGSPLLPRRLWSPLLVSAALAKQGPAVFAAPRPPSLIGALGARGGGAKRRGHSGWGGRPESVGHERPVDSGLGPQGYHGAGPVATAAAGGAAGSGGRGEPPRGLGVRNGLAEPLGGPTGLRVSPRACPGGNLAGLALAPSCQGGRDGGGAATQALRLPAAAPAQRCGAPDPGSLSGARAPLYGLADSVDSG